MNSQSDRWEKLIRKSNASGKELTKKDGRKKERKREKDIQRNADFLIVLLAIDNMDSHASNVNRSMKRFSGHSLTFFTRNIESKYEEFNQFNATGRLETFFNGYQNKSLIIGSLKNNKMHD